MTEAATVQQPPATPDMDRVIWRCDLQTRLGVSRETIRRWLRAARLPPPDVQLTAHSTGWKASTLRAAGINVV